MTNTPDESSPPSFEQAIESLEAIVHELEDGQTGLAESLAKYEQGVKLLKQCYELLQKAERRIVLLTGVGASGEAVTEPFDDLPTATSAADEATASSARSRKRSAKPSAKAPSPPTDDPIDMDLPRSLF